MLRTSLALPFFLSLHFQRKQASKQAKGRASQLASPPFFFYHYTLAAFRRATREHRHRADSDGIARTSSEQDFVAACLANTKN